jgi:hypothetical protein
MAASCRKCLNLKHQADCEDHHITASWVECVARSGIENLRQFPFENTNCGEFSPRPHPSPERAEHG